MTFDEIRAKREKRYTIVRKMWDEGVEQESIAERIGGSTQMVRRIARELGLLSRVPVITDDQKARVIALGLKKMSVYAIQQTLHISQQTIAKILDGAGIRRRGACEIWAGDKRWGQTMRANGK